MEAPLFREEESGGKSAKNVAPDPQRIVVRNGAQWHSGGTNTGWDFRPSDRRRDLRRTARDWPSEVQPLKEDRVRHYWWRVALEPGEARQFLELGVAGAHAEGNEAPWEIDP